MDDKLLKVLAAADDPTHTENPPDFDWQEAMKKVRGIRPALEHIAGRALEFDDQVQDATYFAAYSITEPIEGKPNYRREAFAIYFSCFGHLVAVWNDGIVATPTLEKIIGKMKTRGSSSLMRSSLRNLILGVTLGLPAPGGWTGFSTTPESQESAEIVRVLARTRCWSRRRRHTGAPK